MHSSISRFKLALPRTALALSLTGVFAWSGGALYVLKGSAEVRMLRGAVERKREWASQLAARTGPRVLFCGGSSCLFAIDGERMERVYGLPTANLGLHGGLGARFLLRFAIETCRSGDTLVIALEPGLLADVTHIPMLSSQVSYALGEPNLLAVPGAPNSSLAHLSGLLDLRPGGSLAFTMLGKALRGQPLFRYRLDDMRPSGWQTTAVRLPLHRAAPWPEPQLPSDTRALLATVRNVCAARQIRTLYSLPWGYTPAEEMVGRQLASAAFLREIMQFFPVLRDPTLGCQVDATLFADTVWHLNESGAAIRTDGLASTIKELDFWETSGLETAERELKGRSREH